jgi:uncharacterized membrane protein
MGGKSKSKGYAPTGRQTSITAASYQGPLPPAAQLEQYERTLPGAADRIMTAFEKQVDHRHRMEDRYSKAACRDSTTGLWAGFIITLVALAASAVLIYLDKTVGGTILGTTSLGSLAGVFVYGSKVKRQ